MLNLRSYCHFYTPHLLTLAILLTTEFTTQNRSLCEIQKSSWANRIVLFTVFEDGGREFGEFFLFY